ncbi:MAG: hypothetical protein Q4F40_07420 [Akkermansia sp.]|nr:hypothetical protein [Akkermansia sp.]
MKRRGKKHLHETPAEFAEAEEVRNFRWWQDHQERFESKNKRDSERIMPSHPRPVRGRGDNYETDAQYARRLNKWRKRLGK